MRRGVRASVTRPFYYRDIVQQFDQIGWGSLTVVLLTGFFTGAVLALQSGITLDQFGARPFVGRLVSASMIKELGPVLTALMLTGRVGSGIAAELGSMVVADQVNALRALGTDPVRKLVAPRVLAGTLMCPVLTVVADVVGHPGRVDHRGVPAAGGLGVYWSSVTRGLYPQDPWMGLIKPFFLGFVSSASAVTSACARGAAPRAWDAPRPTRSSPARSPCIAVDFFVTRLLITLMY